MRPEFLDATVLWYPNDCQTDKTHGDIVTKANPNRPKMHLAVRRANGEKISKAEYNAIYSYAKTIVQNLMNFANSDPRLAMDKDSKLPTKTNLKSLFPAEFSQAVLQLEAKHTDLRLCSAHWKAEAIISQIFLAGAGKPAVDSRSASIFSPLEPSPASPMSAPLNLQAMDVVPMNVAKRALELSPGPKSPSASQAQKRSKDDTISVGQKTTGLSVPSNHRM